MGEKAYISVCLSACSSFKSESKINEQNKKITHLLLNHQFKLFTKAKTPLFSPNSPEESASELAGHLSLFSYK